MEKKFITLEHVNKTFRTERSEIYALKDINMTFGKGEFVSIVGPSGCGKSTLLHILGLLDNPDEGSYLLEGEEVGHLKEKDRTRYRKGRIGFVFQSFNLIDELTVEENVDLQLKYLGIPKAERQQQGDQQGGHSEAGIYLSGSEPVPLADHSGKHHAAAENPQTQRRTV